MRKLSLTGPNDGRCIAAHVQLTILAVLLGLAGCTPSDVPKLADVRGTVKLDGQPLPNAQVTFQPEGGGTYSGAITDKNGEYRLTYSRTHSGAMIGTHTVTISTELFLRDKGDGQPGQVPERVPPRYNKQTELLREVGPKPNQIDFDLESGGFPKIKPGKSVQTKS